MVLVLFFMLLISACGHMQDSINQGEPSVKEQPNLVTEAVEFDTEEYGDKILQGGQTDKPFCKDDIYASYLVNQHVYKQKKNYLKRGGKAHGKHYNRSRRQWNRDGLYQARKTLHGPTSPYFGGIPVVVNSNVEHWVRYFKTQGRRTFLQWLHRGESLKETLLPNLKQLGIPLEVFYMAMVESGFSNVAFSRARATGTWQFMAGTAKKYGLKINYWVDERRDPVKATQAAARYLTDLYSRFGDWYLALAAYNAGPGKINRAIRKTKSRDFWKIAKTHYIRRETKDYVPKILAALILATNKSDHGFKLSEYSVEPFPITTVDLKRPVKIAEVASHLSVSKGLIQKWNPEIRKSITPPTKKAQAYSLRLPKDYVDKFLEIEDKLTHLKIDDVKLHKVKSGETLSRLARKYKVSVKNILSMNPQITPERLRIGKLLAIPVPSISLQ